MIHNALERDGRILTRHVVPQISTLRLTITVLSLAYAVRAAAIRGQQLRRRGLRLGRDELHRPVPLGARGGPRAAP